MGNDITKSNTSKYILNETNFREIERRVLELSKVEKSKIKRYDIKIGEYQTKPIYKRTLIIDQHNESYTHFSQSTKPILVFLHGFTGSGVLYYNIHR